MRKVAFVLGLSLIVALGVTAGNAQTLSQKAVSEKDVVARQWRIILYLRAPGLVVLQPVDASPRIEPYLAPFEYREASATLEEALAYVRGRTIEAVLDREQPIAYVIAPEPRGAIDYWFVKDKTGGIKLYVRRFAEPRGGLF